MGHKNLNVNLIKMILYKMELIKINDFEASKLKAISVINKNYGDDSFKIVDFLYDKRKFPAIRVDGNFKLLMYHKNGVSLYTLAIKVGKYENKFKEICRALMSESSEILGK